VFRSCFAGFHFLFGDSLGIANLFLNRLIVDFIIVRGLLLAGLLSIPACCLLFAADCEIDLSLLLIMQFNF